MSLLIELSTPLGSAQPSPLVFDVITAILTSTNTLSVSISDIVFHYNRSIVTSTSDIGITDYPVDLRIPLKYFLIASVYDYHVTTPNTVFTKSLFDGNRILVATSSSYTLTGYSAIYRNFINLVCSTSTFLLSTYLARVDNGKLFLEGASYSLTASNTSITQDTRRMVAISNSISLTNYFTQLNVGGGGVVNYNLPCTTSQFYYLGIDNLLHRKLGIITSSYSVSYGSVFKVSDTILVTESSDINIGSDSVYFTRALRLVSENSEVNVTSSNLVIATPVRVVPIVSDITISSSEVTIRLPVRLIAVASEVVVSSDVVFFRLPERLVVDTSTISITSDLITVLFGRTLTTESVSYQIILLDVYSIKANILSVESDSAVVVTSDATVVRSILLPIITSLITLSYFDITNKKDWSPILAVSNTISIPSSFVNFNQVFVRAVDTIALVITTTSLTIRKAMKLAVGSDSLILSTFDMIMGRRLPFVSLPITLNQYDTSVYSTRRFTLSTETINLAMSNYLLRVRLATQAVSITSTSSKFSTYGDKSYFVS